MVDPGLGLEDGHHQRAHRGLDADGSADPPADRSEVVAPTIGHRRECVGDIGLHGGFAAGGVLGEEPLPAAVLLHPAQTRPCLLAGSISVPLGENDVEAVAPVACHHGGILTDVIDARAGRDHRRQLDQIEVADAGLVQGRVEGRHRRRSGAER
jgi:hypothetical protein